MHRDEDDDDWDESLDDENYGDDFDTEPTIDCPYCGFEMLEICVQCPSCGKYPSDEDAVTRSQPRWVILSALLCLASIFFWFLMQM